MANILKQLEKNLPKDAQITEVAFEGPEIVIYTKNKEFFKSHEKVIKEIVSTLKKRIEVRPDLSITVDMEEAKKKIKEIVPEEAGIKAIYFEPELGKVVIEAQKPGMVIGKGGETYKKIKNETLWLPKIERAPAIDSPIVRAVRNLLHTEIDYRKKFLNKIGQKINIPKKELSERWVRLSCLGSCREVGRSAFLVETPESNVILDFGVNVASDTFPYTDIPEFDIDKIDAVVVSHAHLDHCGYIPWLYENGYTGPLYATAPTRDLMVLLCMDYVDIAHKEGKNVPYTKRAIEKAVKHTIALDYGEVSDLTPDIRLTLQPAGHLLGSSLVHLHIGDGLHNILYTGDLHFGPSRLFEPAYTNFARIETLIIESTYGGANDIKPPRREAEKKLMDVVTKTMEKGGKVLIPSFAVGRAQEVMCILHANKFQYPVYMEGMLWDATAIHTAYPEYLSRYLQKQIFHYGNNPFIAENFKRITVSKEREEVIASSEPSVVIATSGMLVGGPALEYLKAFASDKRNTLLFVGYQAEGSLGRRIQKGWREIPIIGEGGKTKALKMEMEVDTIEGLSGHSDRRQLISFIRNLSSKPERIICNHGDGYIPLELARDLHKIYKVETIAPKNLEVLRLK
ncbi:MAG: beta-CASP ribonuclease aCPSF1 [Candidatus Aenigmarchaeota archaeon]|nr:beta-CASP ribonuclease aCPSF1 [Candidatus Aenigmarchaeota archaeon]